MVQSTFKVTIINAFEDADLNRKYFKQTFHIDMYSSTCRKTTAVLFNPWLLFLHGRQSTVNMDDLWTLILLSLSMLIGCYIAGIIPLSITLSEVSSHTRLILCYTHSVCTRHSYPCIDFTHFFWCLLVWRFSLSCLDIKLREVPFF